MDYARSLSIPLQPLTTVTGSHSGAPVAIAPELLDAVEMWRCILDDDEAARVGANIQARINETFSTAFPF